MYSYNSQSKNISVFDLYMRLILVMPVTTLFQGQINSLNRIVFMVVFLLQIYLLIKSYMRRGYVRFLMVSFIVYIVGLIRTSNLVFDNSIIYYINWIIYVVVITTYKERFEGWITGKREYIYAIVKIWTVLVGVSIFIPSCYYIKEGGARYFGSYCQSIFRLGPTALFIATLAVIMIAAYNDRRAIGFTIIPLYCGLMGSSRTYLFVIGLTVLLALYLFSPSKKQFFTILIPVGVVTGVIYGGSSIAQKVAYTRSDSHYGDFWFRITSSRNVIWISIIDAFNRLPVSGRLFGGGYNFSSDLIGHYAHNDFIEILATHGYVGLSLYLFSMFQMFKNYFSRRPAILLIALSVFVWLINAMFNMFYYYICAALSFPFLLFAVSFYTEKHELNQEERSYENFNCKTITK